MIVLTGCRDNDNDIDKRELGANNIPQFIPEPSNVEIHEGFLMIDRISALNIDNAFKDLDVCKNILLEFIEENIKKSTHRKKIVFNIKNEPSLDSESYELSVNDSTLYVLLKNQHISIFRKHGKVSRLLIIGECRQ